MPFESSADRERWERHSYLFESGLHVNYSSATYFRKPNWNGPPSKPRNANSRQQYIYALQRGPPAMDDGRKYDWKEKHSAWRASIGLPTLDARTQESPKRYLAIAPAPEKLPAAQQLPPPYAPEQPQNTEKARIRPSLRHIGKIARASVRPSLEDLEPLISPRKPSSPPPRWILPLLCVLPLTVTWLAIAAAYEAEACSTAFIFSWVTVAAFALAPVSDQGTDDDMPPPPISFGAELDGVKDKLKDVEGQVESVKSYLTAGVRPWVEPLQDGIAYALQLSMTLSVVGQLAKVFHGEPLAAAVVSWLCVLVQLPDSCAWLFPHVPGIASATSWVNDRRMRMEDVCVAAADQHLAGTKATAQRLAITWSSAASNSQVDGAQAAPTTTGCWSGLRAYITRTSLKRIDELGAIARHSPLKSLVVVLELVVCVHDVRVSLGRHVDTIHSSGVFQPHRRLLQANVTHSERWSSSFSTSKLVHNLSLTTGTEGDVESERTKLKAILNSTDVEADAEAILEAVATDATNGANTGNAGAGTGSEGGGGGEGGGGEYGEYGEGFFDAISTVSTAAATSAFVRRRIRPKEYEQSCDRERARRAKEAARSAAEAELRRCMQPPPLQISLESLDSALVAARDADVYPARIAEAERWRELAVQARLDREHDKDALKETLAAHVSTMPLKVDIQALSKAIERAERFQLDVQIIQPAWNHLQTAKFTQKKYDQALLRLDRALVEPDNAQEMNLRIGSQSVLLSAANANLARLVQENADPDVVLLDTWGVGLDVEELSNAIFEAHAAGLDVRTIEAITRRLQHAEKAQQVQMADGVHFTSRLRGLAKMRKRRETATMRLATQMQECEAALVELHMTRRSALLAFAKEELSKAIEEARALKVPTAEAEGVLSRVADFVRNREKASRELTRLCETMTAAIEVERLRRTKPSQLRLLCDEVQTCLSAHTTSMVEPWLIRQATTLHGQACELCTRHTRALEQISALMEAIAKKSSLTASLIHKTLTDHLDDATMLLLQSPAKDGPMLEQARCMFRDIDAEMRLAHELVKTRKAITRVEVQKRDPEELREQLEVLKATLSGARKVDNFSRDQDETEHAAASMLRKGIDLLYNYDTARRQLDKAIQAASLLCQQGGLTGRSDNRGMMRLGMEDVAKKTVAQLQAAIKQAEASHCPIEDIGNAVEALDAVEAILSPEQARALLDEQTRRRSSSVRRRSLSLKQASGSSARAAAALAEANEAFASEVACHMASKASAGPTAADKSALQSSTSTKGRQVKFKEHTPV